MKIGDRLPNGAIVIAEQAGVILAMVPGSAQPYVTWRWDRTDPKSTIWGHYRTSIGLAVADFETRVTREEGRAA